MILATAGAATRLREWWRPKAGNLLAVIYTVMLYTGLAPEEALWLLLPYVIAIAGFGSLGHLLNDLFDIEADRKAGKSNRMGQLAGWKRWTLIIVVVLIALIPWLFLPRDWVTYLLLATEFLLLTAYSVPPVRLKDRYGWAVATDGAYAYAVPAVLAAYTFMQAGKTGADFPLAGALFCWQLALGARHYLNHLATDRDNDLRAQTHTLATRMGNRYVHRLGARYILPAESLFFACFLVLLARHHLLAALVSVALWGFIASFSLLLALVRRYTLFSFRFSSLSVDQFYQQWWSYALLLMLCMQDWHYWPLVIIHLLVLRPPFMGQFWKKIAPLGWIFLYPVYWLRKKNSIAPAPETVDQPAIKTADFPVIAVVNFNKNKYTETFIWGMVPRLRFQILYLYGDALPRYDHDDLNFLFNSPKLKLIAPLIETIFDLGDHYFLKRSIMSYLQTKQVRLVLAQFGPAGVEMMPVTTDLGIPLVVYFHGYDIFRKDTVEALLPQYRELFQKAAKILCVSAMMQDRLVQLGAPREKVFHLPAFVNLGQFPYSDHAGLPPNFLAVGRFAETKSPHLTILAFEKVVHRIPDARLTFIGQGGGGELFEACIILVKALKLENHVVFKGVQGHEAVAHEMAVNRIFVQHSLTTPIQGEMEGKPVAIMEAMAAGMPIVTTRHSGIAELIEHEVTGLLVSEYDINAMADGMIRLALDDELAGRLGWAAADWIRHEPLIAQNLEYLEDVLMQCIQ